MNVVNLDDFFIKSNLEVAINGVEFGEDCSTGRDGLHNIIHGRERMHWSLYVRVKLDIVCYQLDTRAVTLRNEETRRAPVSWFVTLHYDSIIMEIGNGSFSRRCETKWDLPGYRYSEGYCVRR